MKEILQQLFLKTLDRLSLERVIPSKVLCRADILDIGDHRIEMKRYRRIIGIAFGKAAFPMAETMTKIMAPYALKGVVSGPSSAGRNLPGFTCFSGGHPYPNADSFRSGDAVVELLRSVTPEDLVVYMLSGGGSAICEKPIFPDIPIEDYQSFYKILLTSGANILDVNFIRKHLSAIKGGRLSELAYPARQITIYVSDAPSGNPSNVASGPTMPDESTLEDCYRILARLDVMPRIPASIRGIFEDRAAPETPKPGSEIFRTSTWHRVLEPEDALYVLTKYAREKGWVVERDRSVDDDCALPRAGDCLFSRLEKLRRKYPERVIAVLSGGEYSCPVNGNGVGGRNQAFVLHCVPKIAGRRIAVLSAGTDGIDGVSPAAGAVADGATLRRARRLGLQPEDFLQRCDSYNFFNRLGDTIVTGPTGNNVRDLRILVSW